MSGEIWLVRASGATTNPQKQRDHGEPERLSPLGQARWFIGFACAFSMLMSGCSRRSESSAGDASAAVTIQHEISPQPARVGAASVVLRLAEAAGRPVAGAHIAMEADMTHAGMSPQFVDAKETGSGRYEGQLQFAMAGDWVILLHVTLTGGKKLERQFDVKGVQPN